MPAVSNGVLSGPARTSAEGNEDREAQEGAWRVVDAGLDAFVASDSAGVIIEWNTEAERTFGWRRDEVVGRQLVETISPPPLRRAHRHAMARFWAAGDGPTLGQRIQLSARHRDGRLFPVELTMWTSPSAGGRAVNAFIRDLSERRRAEEAPCYLAGMVESSDKAIVAQDLGGAVVSWNRGARRLFGYRRSEALRRPLLMLAAPGCRDELARLLERTIRAGSVHHHQALVLPKHGPPVDIALTISPVTDINGTVVGASVVAHDVTEQRWLVATLHSTLAALEAALADSRESEARMRQFLADAAHQMRNPIAGIQAGVQSLLCDGGRRNQEGLIGAIVAETSRVGRLLADLLRIASLDNGDAIVRQPCDLVALCEAEARRSRLLAPQLDIVVEVAEVARNMPDLDPHAIGEILSNLVDNARRHARTRIDLVVRTNEDGAEVRVSDDGPGLSDTMAESAFERFVTLDERGGSGLGLPIARGLARAHGGDLTYEGGAFVVTLLTGRS